LALVLDGGEWQPSDRTAALVLGESPKVPSGPQNRSGRFTEDRIFYACLELNPDFSAVHPAAIMDLNPLNPELNPMCCLLALLGAHHFLHVSRIRVKSLTFRRLMSYIYGAPILDVSRSHTTTQHSR